MRSFIYLYEDLKKEVENMIKNMSGQSGQNRSKLPLISVRDDFILTLKIGKTGRTPRTLYIYNNLLIRRSSTGHTRRLMLPF